MHETGEPQRGSAIELTRGGRVAITVLMLVLPAACLVLALTSDPASRSAWLVIAAVNLVLPLVMLPLVWRSDRRTGDAAAVALPAPEPSLP